MRRAPDFLRAFCNLGSALLLFPAHIADVDVHICIDVDVDVDIGIDVCVDLDLDLDVDIHIGIDVDVHVDVDIGVGIDIEIGADIYTYVSLCIGYSDQCSHSPLSLSVHKAFLCSMAAVLTEV